VKTKETIMNNKAATLTLVTGVLLNVLTPVHAQGANTVLNPEHLMDTRQYGYSQAAIVEPGARTVYISGQTGIREGGPNDFESQVDGAFANLAAVVHAANGQVSDIVKITLLVKDHDARRMRYLMEKRRQFFGDQPPASTLIPTPTLALDSLAFEIDAIAVVRE
jgi:enamine deaminase RidA (YjgF/YER057c/UK114 family)